MDPIAFVTENLLGVGLLFGFGIILGFVIRFIKWGV